MDFISPFAAGEWVLKAVGLVGRQLGGGSGGAAGALGLL
jgi:hypothetical protein